MLEAHPRTVSCCEAGSLYSRPSTSPYACQQPGDDSMYSCVGPVMSGTRPPHPMQLTAAVIEPAARPSFNGGEKRTELGGLVVQVVSRRAACVILRRETQPEVVPLESRKHVQVSVKDFLHGRFTIRQEIVDALALQRAGSQGSGRALRNKHHGPSLLGSHIRHQRRMANRHDQQVAQVHWLDIHERGDEIIPVDKTRGSLTGKDPAEDAVSHDGNLRRYSRLLSSGDHWCPMCRNEHDWTCNKTVAYPPVA